MDGEVSFRLARTRAALQRRLALAKHLGIHLQRLGELLQGLGAQESEPALSQEARDSLIMEVEKVLIEGPIGTLLDSIIAARHEEAWLVAAQERQGLLREHMQRAMRGRDPSALRATASQGT